jgi:hypothetical protein
MQVTGPLWVSESRCEVLRLRYALRYDPPGAGTVSPSARSSGSPR